MPSLLATWLSSLYALRDGCPSLCLSGESLWCAASIVIMICGEVTERVKTLHGIAHNYGDLIGACITQHLTIYLHFEQV